MNSWSVLISLLLERKTCREETSLSESIESSVTLPRRERHSNSSDPMLISSVNSSISCTRKLTVSRSSDSSEFSRHLLIFLEATIPETFSSVLSSQIPPSRYPRPLLRFSHSRYGTLGKVLQVQGAPQQGMDAVCGESQLEDSEREEGYCRRRRTTF